MEILTPSTITSPNVGLSIPPKIFKQVVLPAPEGPKIQTSSPLLIVKLASCKALIVTSPIKYFLETFLNSIIAITSLPKIK